MFAKKSTRLIEELNTLSDIGIKCLFINHSDHGDRQTTSGDVYISTHHSQYSGLHHTTQKHMVNSLAKVNVEPYEAVGIDEGQFFNDLNETVRNWVFQKGKIVIIASLEGDSEMKPFGQAHDLECICEQVNVVRLTAFCDTCIKQKKLVNASFTICTAGKNQQKLTGGADVFSPACMECYVKHTMRAPEPIIRVDQLEAMNRTSLGQGKQ
jgi:thymidine kinase